MDRFLSSPTPYTVAALPGDRWLIYHRLQDLDVPCSCLSDGNLQVALDTPVAIAQLWSVTRCLTSPRQHLIQWLEQCWNV